MAGVNITVESKGIRTVQQSIQKLLDNAQNLYLALEDIGDYVVQSTQQRFVDMQEPDGDPWEPLFLETLKNKKRQNRILTETETLADTLHYQLSQGELQIGSNLEYAATHQFGRDEIVARPFLGIAPFERDNILDILQDHLTAGI